MLELRQATVTVGPKRILRDVSFKVASGSVHGLIGRNGAGKSTTVKAILGLQPLASGEIYVSGHTLSKDPAAYKRPLGYIPELPMLYQGLTVVEYLQFTAMAYGVPETVFHERLPALLDRFEMAPHVNEMPTRFSKGMRQKMNVMAALIHDAQVLVVDEPFIGLDPVAIRTLKEDLHEVAKDGGCVLLTTHALDIAESMCDAFTILDAGSVLASGTLSNLRESLGTDSEASLEDVYMSALQHRVATA